jgi:hypothetical protein
MRSSAEHDYIEENHARQGIDLVALENRDYNKIQLILIGMLHRKFTQSYQDEGLSESSKNLS